MKVINVQELIDRQKTRPLHILILLLCAAIMTVDGYDLFMVGAIAPTIASYFHKAPAVMVTVFFVQQVGIAVGSIVMGPISDRYGRKNVLMICTACFGLLMIACALSQNLYELAALRGLSGIFLSGVFPIATTLTSEFAPKKMRARFLSLLIAGYVAGAAGGGAIAAFMIDSYGWQGGFWLGGLVPLACVPLFFLLLPESIQFRTRANGRDPAIARALRRLVPDLVFDGSEMFLADAAAVPSTRGKIGDVLRGGRALPTFLLWCTFFLAMGNGALVSSWTPTFFKAMAHVSVQEFGRVLIWGSAAAVIGTLIVGMLLDRYRPPTVMMCVYALDSAALVFIGSLPFATPAFMVALFVMYACMFAGTAGLMMISTAYYPPSIRATGFGWSIAAGRFGSIVGPLMGGVILVRGLSLPQIYLLVAIPPLIVVLLILAFRVCTNAVQHAPVAQEKAG
jgi:AAHS family 4-hydroxybenzoate transporter-like MFS transporter